MKYLKFLTKKGESPFQDYFWPLPVKNPNETWIPGEWIEAQGALEMCENGIHACTPNHTVEWLDARCFEIDLGGIALEDGSKILARRGRLLFEYGTWNECAYRLFLCDCAARILPIYEKEHPGDSRLRDCLEVARRYACGEANEEERAIAWGIASNVAEGIARDSARLITWDIAKAGTWDGVRDIVRDIARALARDIVRGIARDTARDIVFAAERGWQSQRLMEYLEGRAG